MYMEATSVYMVCTCHAYGVYAMYLCWVCVYGTLIVRIWYIGRAGEGRPDMSNN